MSVKEVAFREWDTGKFREAKVLARRWEKLNNCDQNNCNTSSQPMTLALYGKGSERSPTANLQPHSTNDLGPANDPGFTVALIVCGLALIMSVHWAQVT